MRALSPCAKGVALLVCAASACAEAPPPPAVAPKPEAAPLPPPPPAARWVESGGATLVGPRFAKGTLVLIGGRRALVSDDGSMEAEKAPLHEPLEDLIVVPSKAGPMLVGRAAHGVHRFDDPLGPPVTLARSDARIDHVGAGPGVVAVWAGRAAKPRFLDLETGKEGALAGLPDPPLRALAFVDEKRGAAVFEVTGLAVTRDGGASWRAAAGRGASEAVSIAGVRARGDSVRAFAFADGPDAAVDIDAARLGALLAPPRAPAGAAPDPMIVRWIRGSGRDPLEAAASNGIDLPSGHALVASHGMIARVDPKTGALLELLELGVGKWAPCSAGRSSSTAWIACALPEGAESAASFDPFGVMRLALGEPKLATERPVLVRHGEAELRVSPSGGAMLASACKSDNHGQACVKQPDGAWATLSPDIELAERGVGALADGQIAFLRGIEDGDVGPDVGQSDDDKATKRLHVARIGLDGKERALAPIAMPMSRGYVRVQSPIEEEPDHTLHFVIEDGEGPYSIIVPPGQEAPLVVKIPDAAEARLHAGRGIAVGDGHVLTSLDGGASWNEAPATPAAIEAARAIATGAEPPETLSVSEVGARIGPVLRLGWGPPEATASPEPPPIREQGPKLAQIDAPPAPPARALRCVDAGPTSGLPPLQGASEARALLTGKGSDEKKKHDPLFRVGTPLTPVAMMEGDDKRDDKAVTWTFRWHDPLEIGGQVRRATVTMPPATTRSTSLRFADAEGARALFALRSGGHNARLVRVKAGGKAEIADVAEELAPTGEVVFGADRGEPIAWLHETHVVVWLAGESPRVIAEIAVHASRTLGTPTSAGVPLLVSGADWALSRVLAIPTLDKAALSAPATPVSLDGFTRVSLAGRDPASAAPCGARPKGHRFRLARSALRAEIDGVSESASKAIYDVRIQGSEVCVEGLSALLTAGRKGGGVKPSGKGTSAAPAGVAFVRADLAGRKAEGGDRGLAPDARVRRLDCSLGAKGQ